MKTIVAIIVALACLTVAAEAKCKHFDAKQFWADQDRWVGGGQGQ